jgi:glycosyltransferase involved in cell wall biosynthesis
MCARASHSISACFPAYNEAANLTAVVGAADGVLAAVADAYEIIVVDDGSADGTPEILTALSRQYPGLRSIRHPQNRGYGAAVLTGLRAARHDLVLLCDADAQFDLQELPKLLALIDEADLVTGYRRVRRDSTHRRLNALLWNALIRLTLGVKVRDLNCAFKLFRRPVLERAGLHMASSTGAAINAELLARLGKVNARIREVEVSHYPRRFGQQTGASPRVVVRAFKELLALYRQLA